MKKILAIAVALAIVLSAFVVLSQNPLGTSSADQADNTPGQNTDDTEDETPSTPVDENQGATTITATKTATGFWEKELVYTWTAEKEVVCEDDVENDVEAAAESEDLSLILEPGDYAIVNYEIEAERSEPCITDVFGVRGEITVTNTGCNDTVDLCIYDTVQYMVCDGEWTDLVTVKIDTCEKPVLKAGESYTYSYEIAFEPIEGAEFRNVACVTIENFVDHCDEAYGVEACMGFCLPDCPKVSHTDQHAVLYDVFCVPDGFEVEALCETGPWDLIYPNHDDEWCYTVSLKITNVEAPRGNCYVLCNKAVVVPECSGVPIEACAPLSVFSGVLETNLTIEKESSVRWVSEEVVLGLDINGTVIKTDVEYAVVEEEEAEPIGVEFWTVKDISTFEVCGSIKVTNSGDCPTEGLTITDTIQMRVCGGEWQDIVSISVDISCMPVLAAGESYCYPFTVTFSVNHTEVGEMMDLEFQNIACAEICNYDDGEFGTVEASKGAVYYCEPLCMPCKPEVATIQTHAIFEDRQVIELDDCKTLTTCVTVEYTQCAVIQYFDDCVTMDVETAVTVDGSVAYFDGCNEKVIGVHSSILDKTCKTLNADEGIIAVSFSGEDCDSECATVCYDDKEASLKIASFIEASGNVLASNEDCSFAFGVLNCLSGGILVTLELPIEEEQIPA